MNDKTERQFCMITFVVYEIWNYTLVQSGLMTDWQALRLTDELQVNFNFLKLIYINRNI